MNFYFGQRNHHPLLQQITQALQALITPPAENDTGYRPTIVYTFVDELSDEPGVLFSMGTDHEQHSALVTLKLARDRGSFNTALELQKIDLKLSRVNTSTYDHTTGDQSNTYSRTATGSRVRVDLDKFAKELGESLLSFFTNRYPPALPEFSPWLHH
jgi:hypothetical protein